MRLRYFMAGLAAFVLCGWIPGPQGSSGVASGSSPTFADVTADSLALGAGSALDVSLSFNAGQTRGFYMDAGSRVAVASGTGSSSVAFSTAPGTEGVRLASSNSILWANTTNASGGTADLYLRRSAASTLTVDSDGAGGNAVLRAATMVDTGGGTAITSNGLQLGSAEFVRFSSTTTYNGTADTFLERAEANVLRLDGDGSAGTAAKLAVSGVAPMTSGQTLVLYDEGGDAALTVGTTGTVTAAGDVNYSTDWYTTAGTVTLTDETATTIFTLSVPQGSGAGGTVSLSIYCEDGTDEQIHAEDITWAAVNKAGTITQEIATATTLDADADSTGTLTVTYTITEDTADVISFKVNANTSLTTPTTFRVRFRVGSDTSGVTVP